MLFDYPLAQEGELDRRQSDMIEALFLRVENTLKEHQPALDDMQARRLGRTLWGSVHGLVQLGLNERLGYWQSEPLEVEELLDQLSTTMLAGLKTLPNRRDASDDMGRAAAGSGGAALVDSPLAAHLDPTDGVHDGAPDVSHALPGASPYSGSWPCSGRLQSCRFRGCLVIGGASPRPLRFMMDRPIYESRWLNWLFRLVGAIPVDSDRRDPGGLRRALDQVSQALRDGEVVMLFPEGA